MIAVVSQAWTLDEGAEADAYIRLSAEFLTFMKQQPGFLGSEGRHPGGSFDGRLRGHRGE